MPPATAPSNAHLPLILVRGFGGPTIADERRIAYQGFNDGTVYPRKRGENYVYEGLILRFLKSEWRYFDATNVVGYYESPVRTDSVPPELQEMARRGFFDGNIVVDPAIALNLRRQDVKLDRSMWVYRYYDLERKFDAYAQGLVRLIEFIRELAREQGKEPPKVNILAHSMGGLIVREAIQCHIPRGDAPKLINKVVTLGTPHKGISFQVLGSWSDILMGGELRRFRPDVQDEGSEPGSYLRFADHFPPERLLTVVGTNYRTYRVPFSSAFNRAFSVDGEHGLTYNRSDGLVKQEYAQLPGAPRTFVHKCHGGEDSLVTSREAYEIATRFYFGDLRVRLRLLRADVKRGRDFLGKSEFFFGVGVKPRGVDFELFHQSAEAENCYGPFHTTDFKDPKEKGRFWWADDERLVWEGWLDTSRIVARDGAPAEVVFRLDFYVGERDAYGVGFSDNVVFRKQYYVVADVAATDLRLLTDESFMRAGRGTPMTRTPKGWSFDVGGTGFEGTLLIELAPAVPESP